MSILDEILERKSDEVAALSSGRARLEDAAAAAPPARPFAAALGEGPRLAIVAEIKRRSPSKGVLAGDLDAAGTAIAYERGGAAALSVLTDGPGFGGSLEDLAAARSAVALPVLRKDFTIDEVQVLEARASGADAVLIITAAVPDDSLLSHLLAVARDVGIDALVEVDGEHGLERALEAGSTLVGVTNRDLRTFGEDLSVAERLASRFPEGVTTVAESAIRSRDDAARMAAAGYDAVLVGEHLVRSADPAAAVADLGVERRAPTGTGGR